MKSIFAKVSVVVAAFALALGVAGSADAAITSYLTIGSTGSQVVELQTVLESQGYLVMPAGVAKGTFGPLTKSAVAKWQAAVGLPATGYFGPLSLAKFSAMGSTSGNTSTVTGCTSTSGYSPITGQPCSGGSTGSTGGSTGGTGSLSGGEASLEDFDLKDEDDINEGEEKAEVATVEFRVRDADAEIDRVDFNVEADSGNEEDKPWKVFDKAYLMMDGKTIASMTVDNEDDWSDEDDDGYRLRFTNIDQAVQEDEKAELTLAFDVSSNVDGADSDDATWTVTVPDDGVRAIDGEGIDQYTGDDSESISFDINEAGDDEDLTIRETDDNPDADTLMVEDDKASSWYSVLKFEAEADDSSDITLHELPITLNFSGTSSYSKVIDDAVLVIDGEEFDDFTVGSTTGATTSLTFDLDNGSDDVMVDAGDTLAIEVKLKFKKQSGNYNEGITVSADVSSTNVDAIDAEGADDLDSTQLKGSAEGDDFTLRVAGVNITTTATTAEDDEKTDSTTTDDQGKYTITFKVSAFEQDVYVPLTSASSSSSSCSSGACFIIENSSNSVIGTGTSTSALSRVSGGTQSGNYVRITDGSTATFKLTVNYDPATTGFYRVQLYSVNYSDSAQAPTTFQVLSPEEDYETDVEDVTN